MMAEIYAEYREYDTKYKARREHLEQLIRKHKQSLDVLERRHQGWFDRVLVPLAVHISAELGGIPYEFYGPFGLNCETSVYFFPTEGHDICKDETYSLTVQPHCRNYDVDDFYLTYDTGRRTHEYKDGSIGDLNGFNHVQAELPDSLEEIVALLRHSHTEEGESC